MNLNDLNIEANNDGYELTPELIGFAGYKLQRSRQRLLEEGLVVRLTHQDYRVLIYHNPVVTDYHLPQDALGVKIDKNGLQFGIADGVSIIKHSFANNSGYLSYLLVETAGKLTAHDWNDELKKCCTQFIAARHQGASTILWGSIVMRDLIPHFKYLAVAEPFDTGNFSLFSAHKSLELQNHSRGFVPFDYTAEEKELDLPKAFDLFISTDGVSLDSHDLKDLIKMHRRNVPLNDLTLFLAREIRPNRDDQSLILISAR